MMYNSLVVTMLGAFHYDGKQQSCHLLTELCTLFNQISQACIHEFHNNEDIWIYMWGLENVDAFNHIFVF